DGGHGRTRPAADEAEELHARHGVPDEAGEVELQRARRAEARPLAKGTFERRDEPGMRMAQDQRPPREHVVDVPVPVDVHEIRAIAPLDEERRASDRAKSTYGRAHTAG